MVGRIVTHQFTVHPETCEYVTLAGKWGIQFVGGIMFKIKGFSWTIQKVPMSSQVPFKYERKWERSQYQSDGERLCLPLLAFKMEADCQRMLTALRRWKR